MVTAGEDGTLNIWDLNSGLTIATDSTLPRPEKQTGYGSDYPINMSSYSHDDGIIATGTETGDVILTDAEGLRVICNLLFRRLVFQERYLKCQLNNLPKACTVCVLSVYFFCIICF